ncbi:hypothetical protein DFH11DRAFT_1324541 [Phellopilus nigrolimitatus]|nr:hypothetical protein DFH11DRAFT_1324541 [Phellopilus nigrolimitatus]
MSDYFILDLRHQCSLSRTRALVRNQPSARCTRLLIDSNNHRAHRTRRRSRSRFLEFDFKRAQYSNRMSTSGQADSSAQQGPSNRNAFLHLQVVGLELRKPAKRPLSIEIFVNNIFRHKVQTDKHGDPSRKDPDMYVVLLSCVVLFYPLDNLLVILRKRILYAS